MPEELKPISAIRITDHDRVKEELKQVKDEHAQIMRQLALLRSKMTGAFVSYKQALGTVKTPVAAQVAINELDRLIKHLPE